MGCGPFECSERVWRKNRAEIDGKNTFPSVKHGSGLIMLFARGMNSDKNRQKQERKKTHLDKKKNVGKKNVEAAVASNYLQEIDFQTFPCHDSDI